MFTHSCAGFAVFSHVLCDDRGCRLLASSPDCYSGPGLLDLLQSCGIYFGRVMSYLNSKICLSVKGSVYLSLDSNSHRKWSSGLTPSDFRVGDPEQQVTETAVSRTSRRRARRLLFPQQPPGLGLPLLPTRPALPFRSLPPCRSPRWAIRAAIYAGSLRSKQLGPFTGHAAVAVSPGRGSTAKCDSLQGMPERTSSSVHGL